MEAGTRRSGRGSLVTILSLGIPFWQPIAPGRNALMNLGIPRIKLRRITHNGSEFGLLFTRNEAHHATAEIVTFPRDASVV